MEPDSTIVGFAQRYHKLQAQRETSDGLIQDLILYCEKVETDLRNENLRLSREIEVSNLDLADAINSRRELQKRVDVYAKEIRQVTQDHEYFKNRHPYIAILIDGDGLIFANKYIQQGHEGGKKAAYELRSAVANMCAEYSKDIEISAKVVANLTGLSRAMARDGIVEDHAGTVKDFTLGFTQAMASFDFVDVGYGKERADMKIRESTRWHLQNHNCKQILLGISHDSGYAPFLDEILRDETTRRRVTILEGVPVVKELAATGAHVFNMKNDLFRQEKLGISGIPPDRTVVSAAPPAPLVAQQIPPRQPPTPVSSQSSPPHPAFSTAAQKVAPASPPPRVTVAIPPRTASGDKVSTAKRTTWSPGARGFDQPLSCSQSVLDAVKKRKVRLCKNNYLRPPCSKGDACSFEHDHRITNDELIAVSILTRLSPCSWGQECETKECVYGHHCPNVKGETCTNQHCKYPVEAHPPGTKFRNTYIEDNRWFYDE